jgi:hypothetical protein
MNDQGAHHWVAIEPGGLDVLRLVDVEVPAQPPAR